MSRKIIGFKCCKLYPYDKMTIGKVYIFYRHRSSTYFTNDKGVKSGYGENSEVTLDDIREYGDIPVYYGIDDSLIERAREMEEALGGWVKNTGVEPKIGDVMIDIKWSNYPTTYNTFPVWSWYIFEGDKCITHWRLHKDD